MSNSQPETALIPLWTIRPSRWQPREAKFNEDELVELAHSIQDNGLINPISVFSYPDGDGYNVDEIVAGERRTRACIAIALAAAVPGHTLDDYARRLANVGLTGLSEAERQILIRENATIPAKIEPGDDLQRLHVIAVIENLDRAGLTPIEEARGYQALVDAYGWSQRDLAARVNKSQGYIAQRLALLALPPAAQEAVSTRVLTIAHTRALQSVPEPLQEAVTNHIITGVQQEKDPLTTRDAARVAQGIALFTKPERWEPTGGVVYEPSTRNYLALIHDLIQKVDLNTVGPNLLKLTSDGYNNENLLLKHATTIVNSPYLLAKILGALGCKGEKHDTWVNFATATHRICETCQFSNTRLSIEDLENVELHCPRWDNANPPKTCVNYIGQGDPTIIPINRYLATELQKAGLNSVEEPFPHATDVENYVASLRALRAIRKRQKLEQAEATAIQCITDIRAFWEWQQTLSPETIAHFQAHTCDKCIHYAPLLLAQNMPPCYFAQAPICSTEAWRKDKLRAPDFGMLVNAQGQQLPRCEMFAYANTTDILWIQRDYATVKFGDARDHALTWLERCAKSHGHDQSYDHHAVYGILAWLAYTRQPGNATDWGKLRRYLKGHHNELGRDPGLALLINVASLEAKARSEYRDSHPFTLLNPDTGEEETWRGVKFPLDGIGTYERNHLQANWPKDWEYPWED